MAGSTAKRPRPPILELHRWFKLHRRADPFGAFGHAPTVTDDDKQFCYAARKEQICTRPSSHSHSHRSAKQSTRTTDGRTAEIGEVDHQAEQQRTDDAAPRNARRLTSARQYHATSTALLYRVCLYFFGGKICIRTNGGNPAQDGCRLFLDDILAGLILCYPVG